MAVYTEVSEQELTHFIAQYDIGAYVSHAGIADGVSNTNYDLRTDKGRYILTLFEPKRVAAEDVPFFMAYADALQKGGVNSPEVMCDRQGNFVHTLCDRPACIVRFLSGKAVDKAEITSDNCRKVGATLAKMHLIGDDFEHRKINRFGLEKWNGWFTRYKETLNKAKNGLGLSIFTLLTELNHNWPEGLPRGAIHGDFFPDNVFFKNFEISGVIDFHFACTDLFIYDLAIAVNAWCFDRNIEFVNERFQALVQGYQSVRPLTPAETKVLPLMLRAAALRFLLSRIEEYVEHKENATMTPHDPRAFIKRLEFFTNEHK
jgi:homoserine kinase type II